MSDTPRRLYGPAALTTSMATKYTVPAATTTIIKRIQVVNTTAGDLTFTMSIGADAAGTRLYDQVNVPARGVFIDDCWIVLAATEVVQAKGSATTTTLTLFGVEVT